MGLGFSPLPGRLQLNSRAPSTVQPERHNRSSVIFINADRESLVEDSSRRQQQSVLALLQQNRGLRRWSCQGSIRVNVRVLAVTNRILEKATAAGVQECLRESQLRLSQLAKTANSQNLRGFLQTKPFFFSALQLVAGLHF